MLTEQLRDFNHMYIFMLPLSLTWRGLSATHRSTADFQYWHGWGKQGCCDCCCLAIIVLSYHMGVP